MTLKNRTPKGGYRQDWASYDAAQGNEQSLFLLILRDLCKEVEEPESPKGSTPFSLSDVVFGLTYRTYLNRSSRRTRDDLREAQAKGLMASAPAPNTLSDYLRQKSLTPVLQGVLTKSSLPLAGKESVFAADATAFSLPQRHFWHNKHSGRREKRRAFAKMHVMIGTASNVITYAIPSTGHEHDGGYLKQLIAGTSRYFEITELSADAAYLSGENVRLALLAGAIPYLAFKKNCAIDAHYKSTFWKDMLYLYQTRHPQFTEHYFKRNNVEATFSSLKAKFGGRLRSKSTTAQFNEMLCKAICFNVCVLIQSMFEHGIDPTAWAEVKPKPTLGFGVALARREQELVAIKIAAASRPRSVQEEPRRRSKKARLRKDKPPTTGQSSLFEDAGE